MAKYKSFIHVLRLNRPELDGYLRGKVYVSVKMDGTNAVMFCDDDGQMCYGSRKRKITVEKDNAGFAAYCEGAEDESIENLKRFLFDNRNLIVYGEWLGGVSGRKLTGTIKRYINGGFYVFAVFDENQNRYLTHDEWIPMLDGVYDKIMRPIAVLDNPTEADIDDLLEKTGFDLPLGELGEGIVLYNFGFLDAYGHWQVGKVVRSEYLASKGTRVKKPDINSVNIEQDIVDTFITDAEIAKEQNKIMLDLNEDSWIVDNEHIGRLMSTVWHEFVADSLPTVIKKYKNPTINFQKLNKLSNIRVRDFLKL